MAIEHTTNEKLKANHLKIIGSQEWCAFNEFKIPAVLARIDSGAKTSSIQATHIKLIKKDDENWVRFMINPLQNNTISKTITAKLKGKRSIKGSFGIAEERFIVKTSITIGEDTFEIELCLANRNSMEFRMLLGRNALINRYLINPSEKKLLKTYSKKEINKMYNL
jgi:ribosomal protein S6--L-glutamate ligase